MSKLAWIMAFALLAAADFYLLQLKKARVDRYSETETLLSDCARTHNVYECQLVAVPVTDEKGE